MVKRGKLAVHEEHSRLSPLGAAHRKQSCGNRLAAHLLAAVVKPLTTLAAIDKPGSFHQDSRLPAF
jgi:hypothetical protein